MRYIEKPDNFKYLFLSIVIFIIKIINIKFIKI
jgi:hypothetical protein